MPTGRTVGSAADRPILGPAAHPAEPTDAGPVLSRSVSGAASRTTVAALDVGGTSIKSGVVRGTDVEVLPSVPSRSRDDRDVVLGQLAAACAAAVDAAGEKLAGVAIAVPRPFDLERGIPLLRGLHKFESIHGVELPPVLRSRTAVGDRPIRFAGDAEAAAVGEARFGAAAELQRVLTITLGTGMGACLTDGGSVVTAVGDAIVEGLHDRRITNEGSDERADDAFSVRGLATALGVEPGNLRAAVADPRHAAALEEFGRRLGAFLGPILDDFGAQAVVIGGGLSHAFDRFGPAMDIPAVAASLGARGPLLGAAALAAF
jgi:glucokinase